jgi:Flp pilus assembly protein TadG
MRNSRHRHLHLQRHRHLHLQRHRHSDRLRRLTSDRGAAVTEFVMVSVLLIFLLFAVLQVAVLFYARNIVAASAADGARYAASSNIDPQAGGSRATTEIDRALSSTVAQNVPCTGSAGVVAGTGLPTTVVRCQGSIKSIFLPLGAFVHIDVTARSLTEAPS